MIWLIASAICVEQADEYSRRTRKTYFLLPLCCQTKPLVSFAPESAPSASRSVHPLSSSRRIQDCFIQGYFWEYPQKKLELQHLDWNGWAMNVNWNKRKWVFRMHRNILIYFRMNRIILQSTMCLLIKTISPNWMDHLPLFLWSIMKVSCPMVNAYLTVSDNSISSLIVC